MYIQFMCSLLMSGGIALVLIGIGELLSTLIYGTNKKPKPPAQIWVQVTPVTARFIGKNGSMGCRTGSVYMLMVERSNRGRVNIVYPCFIPYGSQKAYLRNWQEFNG